MEKFRGMGLKPLVTIFLCPPGSSKGQWMELSISGTIFVDQAKMKSFFFYPTFPKST
jgi:hypothetical protein